MSQVGFRVFRNAKAAKEDTPWPSPSSSPGKQGKDQTDEGQNRAAARDALQRCDDRRRRGSIPQGLLVRSGHHLRDSEGLEFRSRPERTGRYA